MSKTFFPGERPRAALEKHLGIPGDAAGRLFDRFGLRFTLAWADHICAAGVPSERREKALCSSLLHAKGRWPPSRPAAEEKFTVEDLGSWLGSERYARLERERRAQIWRRVEDIVPLIWRWISRGRQLPERDRVCQALRSRALGAYLQPEDFRDLFGGCSHGDVRAIFRAALSKHWSRLYPHLTADVETRVVQGAEVRVLGHSVNEAA